MRSCLPLADEREGNSLIFLEDVRTGNGSSKVQNMALTGLLVPIHSTEEGLLANKGTQRPSRGPILLGLEPAHGYSLGTHLLKMNLDPYSYIVIGRRLIRP
jgi:hypothetical protein